VAHRFRQATSKALWLAVIRGLCLVAQGIEGQPVQQPHQLVGHRFEPFHQGLGLFELTSIRTIFEVRGGAG
jgi:hypothetical protein